MRRLPTLSKTRALTAPPWRSLLVPRTRATWAGRLAGTAGSAQRARRKLSRASTRRPASSACAPSFASASARAIHSGEKREAVPSFSTALRSSAKVRWRSATASFVSLPGVFSSPRRARGISAEEGHAQEDRADATGW